MADTFEELAKQMSNALAAAKEHIPPNILGSNKDMHLTREDYKALGISLFIEKNRQKKNGKKDRTGPLTEPQAGYIARLIESQVDSHAVVDQFLGNNSVKLVSELNEGLASDLIDQLKAQGRK